MGLLFQEKIKGEGESGRGQVLSSGKKGGTEPVKGKYAGVRIKVAHLGASLLDLQEANVEDRGWLLEPP